MKVSSTVVVAAAFVLASAIPSLAAYTQEQLQCITGNDCLDTEDFCMEKCLNLSLAQYNELTVCFDKCTDDGTGSCTQACGAQFEKITGLSMDDMAQLSQDAMAFYAASEESSSALAPLATASTNAPSTSAHP
ncbi:hypothetical protein H4R33_007044, partial [Dimargaris cristalligena]